MRNYKDYLLHFSKRKIFDIQSGFIKKEKVIYILNTSVFWGIDYFGEKLFDEYMRKTISV